jgi:hypothetical protein
MTATTLTPAARQSRIEPAVFVLTVFLSAALVFMVEPMVARLVLPTLGGTPAVWNTSLAFFQTALLVGYAYAHLLQRVNSVRTQVIVHMAALVLAGASFWPLRISELMGDPATANPTLWLLGVLTLSLGAPFAVLSATAPLVQAWHARVFERENDAEPYALYAASNVGSLIALLAYPIVVEPFVRLHSQTLGWSIAYISFALVMAGVALIVWRRGQLPEGPGRAPPLAETPAGVLEHEPPPVQGPTRVTWRDRVLWVVLAAIPSSLMLGVTTYITTDVGSAPFLWVGPLALYLLTFVIAFQAKPWLSRDGVLLFQGAFLAGAVVLLPFSVGSFLLELVLQLTCFFLTALMCHQALVARRPSPEHLTEFYLYMSLGGVVGGGFNAFVAPVIFNAAHEYAAVLVLSALARPWGEGELKRWEWIGLVVACASAVISVFLLGADMWALWWNTFHFNFPEWGVKVPLGIATVLAFMLRRRSFVMFSILLVLAVSSATVGTRSYVLNEWRSFFGVVRESRMQVPGLGGEVRMLAHGTTLHGAQAQNPRFRCQPLVYYAHETPIGQVFDAQQARLGSVNIGAVGLGTGSVAAYVRPTDRLTFFEIDPLVVRISTDPRHFSYTTQCAGSRPNFVIGDARLTLQRQAPNQYHVLLIDAFSSDSVPAHLLTVEAIRMYLSRITPDGIVILHLSNRNLNLRGPAMAGAAAAGGYALLQLHPAVPGRPPMWESAEHALIIARNPQALQPFLNDPEHRWEPSNPHQAQPWTDDYTNLVGALVARIQDQAAGRW